MVGWGLLKDALKPAWMLGFTIQHAHLFPHLFPRFAVDTHQFANLRHVAFATEFARIFLITLQFRYGQATSFD